jgi:transposase-like protein
MMKKDLTCPYCGHEFDNTTLGLSATTKHQQVCPECKKTFVFRVGYEPYYYDIEPSDCLNGGKHTWVCDVVKPVKFTKMVCSDCGEERNLTEEEWKQFMERQ